MSALATVPAASSQDILATPFEAWTLQHAREFVGTLRDEDACASRRFYEGDGWQGGKGWMSALPSGLDAAQKIEAIRRLYIHEPLIAEAVDNHCDGVLGREPLWRFVKGRTPRSPRNAPPRPARPLLRLVSPPGPAPTPPPPGDAPAPGQPPPAPADPDEDPRAPELEEQLTDKWDERDTLDVFCKALINTFFFGRAPLRLYVPQGLRNEDGTLAATDFAAAIRLLYMEAPDPQVAGVYVDPDTKKSCGVYVYTVRGQECAEITYLDDRNQTVLRMVDGQGVVTDTQGKPIEWRGDMGGRLFMHEIVRTRLIGESERRNQVFGNYAKTLMARTLELGGYRERNYLNVQPPGYHVDANGDPWTGDPQNPRAKFIPVSLPTGPSTDRFLQGAEMISADGEFKGFANPSLAFEDPVPLAETENGLRNARMSILSSTGQLYLAMTGDGSAAAIARIQARAVHETRLGKSKRSVDGALRWYLEAEARFGAFVSGAPSVNDLRAEANAIVDTGPLTPDEQRAIMERMEKGFASKETGLGLLGSDDPTAEMERIRTERDDEDTATMRVVGGRPAPPVASGNGRVDPAAALAAELATA